MTFGQRSRPIVEENTDRHSYLELLNIPTSETYYSTASATAPYYTYTPAAAAHFQDKDGYMIHVPTESPLADGENKNPN
ncbi:hypothetical protein V1264_016848 [Littorina saxatilis]|uniref:Uncharacterized protein n=1 Tax=Littorina saxatilis TaxID=31220 RepID=A0AAN9BHE2_9CAEN